MMEDLQFNLVLWTLYNPFLFLLFTYIKNKLRKGVSNRKLKSFVNTLFFNSFNISVGEDRDCRSHLIENIIKYI